MRPVLRPGLRLVRDPAGRAVLVDHGRTYPLPDAAAAMLARLDGTADESAALGPAPEPETLSTWRRLRAGGVVVDLETPLRLASEVDSGGSALGEAAALVAEDPFAASRRWGLRRKALVAVDGDGVLVEGVVALLRRSGVGAVVPAAEVADRATEPTLTLLGHDHEPPADSVEPLMRSGCPHLAVGRRGAGAVVGPFVRPGATPCLRCVDLSRCQSDPAWAAVRDQVSAPDTAAVLAAPASGVVLAAATALAAAEVLAHVEGRQPATVAATATLSSHTPFPALRSWPTQPSCGCAWQIFPAAR
jgi:bacteriocin biosynthesis cyclodehydratase domain-containing protein